PLASDAARAYEGDPEAGERRVQLLRAQVAKMPTGPPVNANEAVHALREGLFRPAPVHDVVVDDASSGMDTRHDPLRIAERCHEKSHALLERLIHPSGHPPGVDRGERLLR